MAEGVVVMVCPALLALVLDKVDHKVYGHRALMAMLTMAGVTLISGICPVLLFYFSQRFPAVGYVKPAVTAGLATLSYSCLLILACFIPQPNIVPNNIRIPVGALCGGFVLVRTVCYYFGKNVGTYGQNLHDILDESHEFLTGVTGILFLGLEGLALESNGNQMFPKGGMTLGTISFIFCALGVCLMYLEMTPPLYFNVRTWTVGFTLGLDILMAAGTFVLLIVTMVKLMGVPALVLLTPPVGIIGELVYRVATNKTVTTPDTDSKVPASLELTRVAFTGFLAVSITAISNTSPSRLTVCFLLFVAAAIVSGILWRLLTQSQIRSGLPYAASPAQIASPAQQAALRAQLVASSANLASFCTHFCIVIATILFLAMAGAARGK
jgi:hypothetical protein